ncbi:neuropeptide FF receptor 2-like [Saccostrea echinata]|uniref:neuropeptide FF receptor 2-like n=1 Tax=Saccostrea echinata TaxID=191078 RepID=UPI002A7FDE1E|nr:neuropeptide FF receptor 2-like [Saccostrea echinata]
MDYDYGDYNDTLNRAPGVQDPETEPCTQTHTTSQPVSVARPEELFCPVWLRELPWPNTTTIEDVNVEFRRRNIPGIYFISLQMLLGLIGNLLVIVVYFTRFKISNYRVFVLFLAFLDLINCVLVMPFGILYLYYPINFPSNFICKAGHFVGFFGGVASPLMLVVIAIDRFRKVCRPLKKQITEKQAKISCTVIVFMTLSVTWFTPWFYGNAAVKTNIHGIEGTRCFRAENEFFMSLSKWYYNVLISMFLVVTIILSVLYYFIMKSVHSHSKYFSSRRKDSVGSCSKNLQTRKSTVTFMIITIVYVISTLTHDALAMVLHLKSDLECDLTFTTGTIYYTFFWTVFLNNVSNPFIYGLSDDRFSSLIRELFKKRGTGLLSRTTLNNTRSNSKRSSSLSAMITQFQRQSTFSRPLRQASLYRKPSVSSRTSVGSNLVRKQSVHFKSSAPTDNRKQSDASKSSNEDVC